MDVYDSNINMDTNFTLIIFHNVASNGSVTDDVVDVKFDLRLIKTTVLCVVLLALIALTCCFVMRTFSRFIEHEGFHRGDGWVEFSFRNITLEFSKEDYNYVFFKLDCTLCLNICFSILNYLIVSIAMK